MGKLRIGLTGGIGSGKSTVAAMLVARGAELIDTDAIARDLTRPDGTAVAAIRASFGDDAYRRRRRPRPRPHASRRVRRCHHSTSTRGHPPSPDRRGGRAAGRSLGCSMSTFSTSRSWPSPVAGALAWIASGWSIAARNDRSRESRRAPAGRRTWPAPSSRSRRAARFAAPTADAVIDNDGAGLADLEAEVDALWQSSVPLK